MKFISSACAGVLVLLAGGFVFAQQATGSQAQPSRVETSDLQFAGLVQDETAKKAELQAAEAKAAAKEQERQKAFAELNRAQQANEDAEAFRSRQREETRRANQLDREATQARAQANRAGVSSNDAERRVRDAMNANPSLRRPSTAAGTPNATAPAGPTQQRPRITLDPLGRAWGSAVNADVLRDAGGRVFDTSRTTSGAPPVAVPSSPTATQFFRPSPNRPPPPVQTAPVIDNSSRQRRSIPSPGGVIIAATADIAGLKPADVASASFDGASGILTLALRSGKQVTCKLDADDFAVAVRTVFDQQVDPTLSMSYDAKKPGFLAVDYTGPMFKTRFGKLMYEADVILGAVIFNREGDHREPASAVVPSTLVFEAGITGAVGSRVFLVAGTANFAVENDRLVCRQVESKVQVTASGYAADYFEEAMHRVARVMDENFDALTEKFTEFKEFRRLAECVAIAKWLKRHSVAFDWAALKTRTLAEHDFPAYVPGASWGRLFNGRSLDGWRLNLPSGQFDSALKDSHLTLRPTGQQPLEILKPMWSKAYDLRYVVETEGPVEFIIREGSGTSAASVAIDTKGQRHALELFLRDGRWSVIAPGVDKAGEVTIPETKAGEPRQPADFGMRVPPGSKLILYAAAMRRW